MNAVGVAGSEVGGLNASGCGRGMLGDDVGNENASSVEENTWLFPTRLPLSKLNKAENQPIVDVVVGGNSSNGNEAEACLIM